MASAAQILANQSNSQLSTGPRTVEGKAASARNAVSHGLTSKSCVVLAGEEQEFAEFLEDLDTDIQPEGAVEHELFRHLAHAAWTLRRCQKAEANLFLLATDNTLDPLLDGTNEAKLARLDLYSRRAERAFHRALKELRVLQTERQLRIEAQPPDEFPEDEDTMRSASSLMDSAAIGVRLAAGAKAKNDLLRANSIPWFLRGTRAVEAIVNAPMPGKQTKPIAPVTLQGAGDEQHLLFPASAGAA